MREYSIILFYVGYKFMNIKNSVTGSVLPVLGQRDVSSKSSYNEEQFLLSTYKLGLLSFSKIYINIIIHFIHELKA
jgi:hypothetical protein